MLLPLPKEMALLSPRSRRVQLYALADRAPARSPERRAYLRAAAVVSREIAEAAPEAKKRKPA